MKKILISILIILCLKIFADDRIPILNSGTLFVLGADSFIAEVTFTDGSTINYNNDQEYELNVIKNDGSTATILSVIAIVDGETIQVSENIAVSFISIDDWIDPNSNNVPPYITIVADCSAIISLDGTYPINPPLGN